MRLSMKRLLTGVTTTAAVAAVLALTAGPASAITYTVTVGGSGTGTHAANASMNNIAFTDVTHIPNTPGACTTASGTGHVYAGSSIDPVADVSSSAWSGCTIKGSIPITVTPSGTWKMHVTALTAGGATGYVDNVTATVTSPVCSFTLTGSFDGSWSNSGQTLTATNPAGTSHHLVTSGTVGCVGLGANGDTIIVNTGTVIGINSPDGLINIS